MIFGMVMVRTVAQKSGAPPMNAGSMFFSVLIYGLLAAFFITMGIGSIRARRWARALMLVVSWLWLVVGIGSVIAMVFLFGHMFDKMAAGGQMPQAAIAIVKIVTTVFMTLFYIILPAIFVFFYRSPHVKATCEQLDPVPRWTDRCPLPVLALVLMFGYAACCMPAMGFYNWAIPCFGRIITGAPGAAMVVVFAAVWGWMAWAASRQKIEAWWAAILITCFWAASACTTFARVNIMDFYAQMKFPKEQLDLMKSFMPDQSALIAFGAIWFVAFIGR